MSMKLCILGLLLEGDMHPYEMTIMMKDRAMDSHTKLQMGSLYYAVDQLAKGEYIEAVKVVRSGNRPDKTIYHITEKGRQLFEQLLLQKFKEIEPVYHPMYIGLAFARHGDQEKIAKILENRIREVEHRVNLAYEVYEEHIKTVPRSALHIMIGMYEHAKAELIWLKRLYADVREGKMGQVGLPLDLEEEKDKETKNFPTKFPK
ncbi:PadR family transcriptional regulator [Paenibacillus sediminis]|uniref:DNA-binding PadR family transcriptional regulator n=1 Tax=Paenibacillus sediminis TaxID=664909 RepID=A0ABS4H1A4_9BACL|nr:PadR family transcriptional regulator [Paenibacillus sediminis]MBP1936147.1 DNA-binding PadR family transcriptional regulator [Paenibacillus sediminis]